MMKQTIDLQKKPHIIVATPGRLLEHLYNNNVSFARIKYLVCFSLINLLIRLIII